MTTNAPTSSVDTASIPYTYSRKKTWKDKALVFFLICVGFLAMGSCSVSLISADPLWPLCLGASPDQCYDGLLIASLGFFFVFMPIFGIIEWNFFSGDRYGIVKINSDFLIIDDDDVISRSQPNISVMVKRGGEYGQIAIQHGVDAISIIPPATGKTQKRLLGKIDGEEIYETTRESGGDMLWRDAETLHRRIIAAMERYPSGIGLGAAGGAQRVDEEAPSPPAPSPLKPPSDDPPPQATTVRPRRPG